MERVRYDLMLVINTPTFAVICNSAVWAVSLCVSAHRHRIPFLGIQPSNVPLSGSLEQMESQVVEIGSRQVVDLQHTVVRNVFRQPSRCL